jgi:hypothetical protein
VYYVTVSTRVKREVVERARELGINIYQFSWPEDRGGGQPLGAGSGGTALFLLDHVVSEPSDPFHLGFHHVASL